MFDWCSFCPRPSLSSGALRSQDWGTNSQCSHATSDTVEGPYTFRDTAVPVWCHNPQVVQLPTGLFAMFHIGAGAGGNPANCTSTVDADGASEVRRSCNLHGTTCVDGAGGPAWRLS